MSRKRVYIAGKYSADNVLDVLDNIRIGTRMGTVLLMKGFAPFCPWLDHQFQFMLQGDEKLVVEDYYEYSLAWLEVSQVMLVLPGFENSKGTAKEIERAKELFIPICYNMDQLDKWNKDIIDEY
jgi:hypothetical protein